MIEYNIYRGGALLDVTTGTMYEDTSSEHDVEYCYIVTATYPSGESLPTNEACAMWELGAPVGLSTNAGNGFIELSWNQTNYPENEAILGFNIYRNEEYIISTMEEEYIFNQFKHFDSNISLNTFKKWKYLLENQIIFRLKTTG